MRILYTCFVYTKELSRTDQEIITLYNKGTSLTELAALCGCKSYCPIKRCLLRHAVPLRAKGKLRPTRSLSINEYYFKEIDSHEKAYWLGYIYADGCLQKSNKACTRPNKLSFCINTADRELLDRLTGALNSNHKIVDRKTYDKRTKHTYNQSIVQITCSNLVETIIDKGITVNKSYDCKFPDIKEEFQASFIRGIFDGDGYIGTVNGYPRMTIIVNKSMTVKIIDIICKNTGAKGLKPQVVDGANNSIEKICYYRDTSNVLSWLYTSSTTETRLNRKYHKFLSIKCV
jgi:hypothetical protein